MRTAGLMMNDVWAHRVLHEHGVEAYRVDSTEADLRVLVESVDLKHRTRDENYRPYLHLTGELRSITPAAALPFGISQVTYSPGQGEKVDAFYEFDDDQLVVLASKGYFSKGFAVPEAVSGIEWELPAQIDALVVAPSNAIEGDAPLVFTKVHRIADLEIDVSSSGYDLAQYFADHAKGAARTRSAEPDLVAEADAIDSLFDKDDVGLDRQGTDPALGATPSDEPVVDMSTHLQQIEADIAAESEQYRAEREAIGGTPERLYLQRVASALQDLDHRAAPVPAVVARHLGLEVEADVDLDPASDLHPDVDELSYDERKREVARRAADLDPIDFDDKSFGS